MMGVGVVPLAIITSALHGQWFAFWNLILAVVLVFVPRAIVTFVVYRAARREEAEQELRLVRELENCVARAVTLGDHKIIDVNDLPPAIRTEQSSAAPLSSQDSASLSTTALAEMERMTILRVFEQANGDKALAGKMLGISRATLYRKLKRYNIPVKAGSSAATPEQQRAASH